ncbi:MAG: hypothetical protein H6825_14140, partial [Planctomycetes bacterium]|nr:hypothetical protein [Planctomycetota bacterium]
MAVEYGPARTHAPGVGRYARELVRALVRRRDAPRLLLLETGRAPRAVPESALGLAAAPAGLVTCVRSRLPERALAALARLGQPLERRAGGCDLVQRVRAFAPCVVRAPAVLTLSELPRQAAARGALARTLDGLA